MLQSILNYIGSARFKGITFRGNRYMTHRRWKENLKHPEFSGLDLEKERDMGLLTDLEPGRKYETKFDDLVFCGVVCIAIEYTYSWFLFYNLKNDRSSFVWKADEEATEIQSEYERLDTVF